MDPAPVPPPPPTGRIAEELPAWSAGPLHGSATAAPSVAPTVALPVALALSAALDDPVRRWVEGILGWQPVEDEPDGPVPPVVRLADPTGFAAPDGGRRADVPTVLLVTDRDGAAASARAAARIVPAGIVAWPREREALADTVTSVLAVPRARRRATRLLRVGGAAGGVGATTVALALAGLAGWARRSTLVVVHGHAPVRDAPRVPGAALASPDLWSRAAPLVGVEGTRVLAVDGSAADAPAPRGPELVVLDAGTDADVDVLVCRADAAALAVVPTTSAGAVVIVGQGLVPPARLAIAAGGRRVVHLPTSARVARAHLEGLVPTALPGRWLRLLVPLVDAVVAGD